jgi:hypothetical protein
MELDLEQEYEKFGNGAMKVWGKEIALDARCDKDKVNDPSILTAFLKELVIRVGMKAYKEPQIELFGEGGLYGYSALQWIHTSNIVLHTTLDGQLYLNLFSCKTFDELIVEKCVIDFFGGEVDFSETTFRGVRAEKLKTS